MSNDKVDAIKRPSSGFIFWPVGTGDSTTLVVDDEVTLHVDLNNLEAADDEDDPRTPVIDQLEKILPVRDGKPFLASFVLTHPDQDHCRGFGELLDRVTIGELWFTPRVFREYQKDLCEDAKKFRKEAKRRVQEMIENDGEIDSGNRVRIIGYDDLLEEADYKGFPKEYLTIPGNEITEVDREDLEGKFRAFIHAPFKDDSDGDRNDTSVAMQITLISDGGSGQAMMFGDLSHPVISNIFERSEEADLAWDLMLAAHHCSKSVMYWQGEDDDEEKLKKEILENMEKVAKESAYVISSSEPVPSKNKDGDNPPHAKAKNRYQEIVEKNHFLCTQEHPDTDNPLPIIFEITKDGINLSDVDDDEDDNNGEESNSALGAAIIKARGEDRPPSQPSRYGHSA